MPNQNYFQNMLQRIMFQQTYPRGTSERKKIGGDWYDVAIPPEHLTPNQRKSAHMRASELEDNMLREQLGSQRRLGEHENMPAGAYTLADFPGARGQVWGQESGFLPRGYGFRSTLNESDQDRLRRQAEQRRFAQQQRRLLGW